MSCEKRDASGNLITAGDCTLMRPLPFTIFTAHHVHAFLDNEVSNPFSSVMEDPTNQLPACSSASSTQVNSNQISEQTRFQQGNGRTETERHKDGVNVSSSKTFDGSSYYRQSNVMLNSKQRGRDVFEEPQHSGYHRPVTSLSQVQIKVPSVDVSSELSVYKSSEAGSRVNGIAGSSENTSYLERLKRSFPSSRSHVNSDSQETVHDKFSQRSLESSHKKEKHNGDTRSKKEHSPKSVSFATSVKDVGKSASPDDEDDRGVNCGPSRNTSATPRVRKVQSNVMTEGIGQNLFESGLQNWEMRRSFDQKPRQQTPVESKHSDTGETPLPPSPPTRDTNRLPNQRDSQTGSVQILSLFDEKSLFVSNLSGSFPRQSNVDLKGFDGSGTLRSSAGSSFGPKRDQFVHQSNSKVNYTPSRSLRASRDASLMLDELLSSGSVNSSPDNSPPTKFERNSGRSKKEHSLDDYDDHSRGLLQDLRYKLHIYTVYYVCIITLSMVTFKGPCPEMTMEFKLLLSGQV